MIRTAVAADLDAVLAVDAAGFPADPWSSASWTAELTGADRRVLLAEDAAGPLGVATFQVVYETADLHRIAVTPAARRRGLGRRLVVTGLDWAAARGAERCLLEVEHDNAAAHALYTGLGFVEIARRPDYYGPGRHALVMSIELAGRPATEGEQP